MSDQPISGREPSLGGISDLSGNEPFIGGAGSLGALLATLGETDTVTPDTLIVRLSGVIPQLIPFLEGEDPRLRRNAARMIGLLAARHPETRAQTVPLLIAILDQAEKEHDWPLIEMSIDRLGECGDGRAVERLFRINSSTVLVRLGSNISGSLARLGLLALGPLVEQAAYAREMESHVYLVALAQLCRTSAEARVAVADWLLRFALDANSSAYWRIGVLARHVAAEFQVERLAEVVNDAARPLNERQTALQWLSEIHDPRVTAVMFALLAGSERAFHRIARRALVNVKFREDIPNIIKLIESPDARIKRDGLRIAGLRHIKAALLLVGQALGDPKEAVRREAILATRRIRDASAVESILPLITDRAAPVRRRAVDALAGLAWYFPEQRPAIEAAVREVARTDADPGVRAAAQNDLAYLVFRLR